MTYRAPLSGRRPVFALLAITFLSTNSDARHVTSLAQTARRTVPAGRSTPGALTGALKVITGQPGSVIFINQVRHGVTNDQGELDLARVKAGTFSARVRTAGYSDWNGTVTIISGSSRVLKVSQKPADDEALLHFQKGDQLRDKGKYRDSVTEYQQALALRAVFPECQIAVTRSLIPMQDFQEAERHIQSALRSRGPTLAEAQTVLANLRRNQGLYDESIAEYRKALVIARGISPEAHIGLGIALKETGSIPEAIKEYRIGIVQDMDTEPILYYQLGEICEAAGRTKEAIDAYRSYLRLDPEGEYASAVESVIERLKEEKN
jgi:predicted Zn-dependent protease